MICAGGGMNWAWPPSRLCDQRIRHPARRAGSQEARPVALTTTRQSALAGFPLRLRDRAVARVGVFHVRLRQGPLLVGAVGAVPDLGLGSRAAEAGVVQALAGLRVQVFAVGLVLPGLGAGAVARVQVDGGAVGGAAGIDVEAVSERLQGVVGCRSTAGRRCRCRCRPGPGSAARCWRRGHPGTGPGNRSPVPSPGAAGAWCRHRCSPSRSWWQVRCRHSTARSRLPGRSGSRSRSCSRG